MKKLLPFFALVLGLSILTACSKTDGDKEEDKDTPSQTEEADLESTEEDNENEEDEADEEEDEEASVSEANSAEKINVYVDCINNHSNRVLDSYDYYTSWANEETGPTGNETVIYGLYSLIMPSTECAEGLKKAVTLKPSYPTLEKAGTEYAASLVKIEPLLTEADDYYSEENYKDDAMAKGKELHPKLIAAFKEFEAVDTTMRAELDKIQDELDVKRLAELEKTEGKKHAWHVTNTMMFAKKLSNQANVADLAEIKLEELQKAVEDFEKAFDEFKAYDQANKGTVTTAFFFNSGDSLVKAGKELMRRVRDNVPFETGETMTINAGNAESVSGTPSNVMKAYNDLVTQSNSMNMFTF